MLSIKIRNLLDMVNRGEIVIPDFQRNFVWRPEDVRELLVSIVGEYFIGTILWTETTKASSPFALRLVEGVSKVNPDTQIQDLVKIVLDGQQRITSLYYAFYQPEIPLKDTKNPYRFYLNIEKALNGDYEEAVIGISRYFNRELMRLENDDKIIPFREMLNMKAIVRRFSDTQKLVDVVDLVNEILDRYEIHVVNLPLAQDDLEKVVETFERINRTGLSLSIFDLMTARLYKYDINLRQLLKEAEEEFEFVKFIKPEFILKVIALIRDLEPKRKNILNLSHEHFEKEWYAACEALELAFRRVESEYGVLDFDNFMPYTTMLVPMAGMIHFLKNKKLDSANNYKKIDVWYWSSVFTERYDQAVDSKSYRDYKDFKDWVLKGKSPEFIEKFSVEEVNLDVESPASAIHRGVLCLVNLKGAYDFQTGQKPSFEIEKVQIDHIFPQSHFNENRILVKTLLSTNQRKIDKKPSEYFRRLIDRMGEQKVKEILETHLIPANALDDLLNDDLEGFMEKRKKAIINEVKERTKVESI